MCVRKHINILIIYIDKITGLLDRHIFKELNNIYTEFMAKELISTEEKEQKHKKKHKKSHNATKKRKKTPCSCATYM